jgi:predicted ATPase/DNA-binding winged helix-turn-helix (wHTH) protein
MISHDHGDPEASFGPYRLVPARQLLLEANNPLRIGTRALDILIALVERSGQLVSKEELIARVWPNTFVEEGNLRVHVAMLRKTLGDGQAGNRYIATLAGRGYRFIAPVSWTTGPGSSPPQTGAVDREHNLPAPLARIVGRAAIVSDLVARLPQRRFITLVGLGGIGKTTVALAAAEAAIASYEDGARFVDLASLNDPVLVPGALASVLGAGIRSETPIPGLVAFLKHKRMLLVLDSCEHVVEAAARLALEVLKGAPGVDILATSREPLRAEGEHVQRLAPLGTPAVSTGVTAAEALAFPAVQLFVERVAANVEGYELSDGDAPTVADICRRLDGIALAIELAASRVDFLGVQGLAKGLDDRFRLLIRGRRTALPRHRMLSATLDWSYEFLPESERLVLRRLAVFAGSFTLEAASAVAENPNISAPDAAECVENLISKSLVAANIGGTTVRYRLLETMRAYHPGKARREWRCSRSCKTSRRVLQRVV